MARRYTNAMPVQRSKFMKSSRQTGRAPSRYSRFARKQKKPRLSPGLFVGQECPTHTVLPLADDRQPTTNDEIPRLAQTSCSLGMIARGSDDHPITPKPGVTGTPTSPRESAISTCPRPCRHVRRALELLSSLPAARRPGL